MPRATVIAIVEGQTENAVLTKLLGSHLAIRGVDFTCKIIEHGGGRGGTKNLRCETLCNEIRLHLRDRRWPVVTTFFDYYALPMGQSKGWEFVQKAKADISFRGLAVTVQSIEVALHRLAIEGIDLPNIAARVIPYIQLHELEALFFAEPGQMAAVFEKPYLERVFADAVTECGGCEKINDTPQKAPSKRIQEVFPGYIKGRSALAHGPRLAAKLDLTVVRTKCPRFSEWVSKLEALSPT